MNKGREERAKEQTILSVDEESLTTAWEWEHRS